MKEHLTEIAKELKGIRSILACMWHSRYKSDETDQVAPDIYADEFISVDECAKRLGVTEQTIRNWILQGARRPGEGWTQGVHYINVPTGTKKSIIRIPWSSLILAFSKGPKPSLRTFDRERGSNLYTENRKRRADYVPNPSVPDNDDPANS